MEIDAGFWDTKLVHDPKGGELSLFGQVQDPYEVEATTEHKKIEYLSRLRRYLGPASIRKRCIPHNLLTYESGYQLLDKKQNALAYHTAHFSALNGPWGPMLVVWMGHALLAVHLLYGSTENWQEEVSPESLIRQWQGLTLAHVPLTLSEFRTKKELLVVGTAFQVSVWKALLGIPMGYCTTYTELARHLNMDNAYRAIGTAVGANVLAGIIPCHRVVGKQGELTGFRWGLNRKALMLALEAAAVHDSKYTLPT